MLPSLLLVILIWLSLTKGNTFQCREGERLSSTESGDEVCIPCDDGVNFMSKERHTDRTCQNCSQIVDPGLEVLVRACNRTHDAEILCRDGYYRYTARNVREKNRCEPCQVCEHAARACQGHNDTVCCPAANYDAVMNSVGQFECKEKPVVCDPGQYLRRHKNECLPCPDDTYMAARNHRNHRCLKCEPQSGDSETHAVIVRQCSSTSPTLFGCKTGYFRDPSQESTQIEVTCVACQVCRRELRECDMFHDAICDQNHVSTTVAVIDRGDGKPAGDEKTTDSEASISDKFNTDTTNSPKDTTNSPKDTTNSPKDTTNSQNDTNKTSNVDADGVGNQTTDHHHESISHIYKIWLIVIGVVNLIHWIISLIIQNIQGKWSDHKSFKDLCCHIIRTFSKTSTLQIIAQSLFFIGTLFACDVMEFDDANASKLRFAMTVSCYLFGIIILIIELTPQLWAIVHTSAWDLAGHKFIESVRANNIPDQDLGMNDVEPQDDSKQPLQCVDNSETLPLVGIIQPQTHSTYDIGAKIKDGPKQRLSTGVSLPDKEQK